MSDTVLNVFSYSVVQSCLTLQPQGLQHAMLPSTLLPPGVCSNSCLLEKAMAPHSSTLAWKIPWAEEPGGLQFMGSLRVRHDWATSLPLSCIGEGNGIPLQCSCLENPRDGGAWWATVYGVAQSRTWLKRLSSSSSSMWCLINFLNYSWENCKYPLHPY